ncbi:MAG: flagellar basal body-associated FliL family protein, partial [Desulfobacterales bacterium]
RKHPWKRKIFVISVWGISIFVALLAYPAFKGRRVIPEIPSMKWFPVRNAQSIRFESFIVPFKEPGKFTYISLSISFKLPNKKIMDEMIEKNTRIRGIIYSILGNNINILKNVSSLKKLKELITNGVNGILKDGKVNEAIITDFSTV